MALIINNKDFSIFKKIDKLEKRTSISNWDYEHGNVITKEWWSKARYAIQKSKIVPHWICPCGDGSIHIKWENDGYEFLLEMGPYQGSGYYKKEYLWTITPCERINHIDGYYSEYKIFSFHSPTLDKTLGVLENIDKVYREGYLQDDKI